MKTILIMVGTELLNGGTADTNSLFIAEELNKYGIEIESKIIVRDFMDEIIKALDYATKNSKLIIMSGGLGPTLDDLTKDAIAEFLGKKLIVDEQEETELRLKYETNGLIFHDKYIREIQKPEGAISFGNEVGMAPAIFVDGIVAFPGVPMELRHLFPIFIDWYSKEFMKAQDSIYIKDLITVGIPESKLEEKVKKFFTAPNIYYEFLVKDYGILVRMQSSINEKNAVEKIMKKLYNVIGDFIYGEDDDRIENLLVELLERKNMKISVAESCTGGLISGKIIGVAGSSKVFEEGLVTYSDESKKKRLGVKVATLKNFGAVSKETCLEMLKGLKTEAGISVTGIAGPDGGTEDKPVGLVYIGLRFGDEYVITKCNFMGNRERIREKVVLRALFDLYKKGVNQY
ncbi:MAG: CinA family nicotinamide mononucleotide deamidase-related protein [Fusobacteriaceae bacterium]